MSTHSDIFLISMFLIISALVYPYSKIIIEVVVLSFKRKAFWSKGLFAKAYQKIDIYRYLLSIFLQCHSGSFIYFYYLLKYRTLNRYSRTK